VDPRCVAPRHRLPQRARCGSRLRRWLIAEPSGPTGVADHSHPRRAYPYSRQRSTRILASRSGSLTISKWQVSISMSVCTPPSAAMHSC
jgi:hypothetical protein